MMKVNFNGKLGTSKYSICDGCHANARVAVLELPTTKYYDRINLETKYREYWLCDDCRGALTRLLNRLEAVSDD